MNRPDPAVREWIGIVLAVVMPALLAYGAYLHTELVDLRKEVMQHKENMVLHRTSQELHAIEQVRIATQRHLDETLISIQEQQKLMWTELQRLRQIIDRRR